MDASILKVHIARFENLLTESLIMDSQGNIRIDKAQINKRSRWAANAYMGALTAGNAEDYCEKIAEDILFEGLQYREPLAPARDSA